MEYTEALDVLKNNYPPPEYRVIREALDICFKLIEEKMERDYVREDVCEVEA